MEGISRCRTGQEACVRFMWHKGMRRGWGGVAETEKREEMTREKEIKVVTD